VDGKGVEEFMSDYKRSLVMICVEQLESSKEGIKMVAYLMERNVYSPSRLSEDLHIYLCFDAHLTFQS
jgi:hypothetical protein